MPFSFNPGQSPTAQQASPSQTQGVVATQPSAAAVAAVGAPSVPDSPFLFMQHRGQEMTVNAYLQMILLLVAVLSVVGALTLFLYSMYLTSSIASKKEEIALKDSSFKEYPLADMKRFSSRMVNLEKILKDYVSVRSPLKLLEDVVEKQVVFNEFMLSKKDAGYVVSFTAITTNYRALVQQLEALSLDGYKKVAPDPKLGKVTDGSSVIKVSVTTPVFVQGVLPDDIVFIRPSTPVLDGAAPKTVPQASSTPQ